MPPKIEASERPLQKVFSADFDFRIPLYQRPYAWTTKEAGELFSDLLDNMGEPGVAVEETNPYFLGSVVLVKGDTPKSDVVDGQQRLTTLTILFAALRKLLTAEEAFGLTALLYETANPILGTKNRYRLTMRKQDEDFFRSHIQDVNGLDKLETLNAANLTDSRQNIRENALLFIREASKLSSEKRSRFVQYAARRCYLVVVSTPDFNSAYRIFTVLNNRGLNLTTSDILKAEWIGTISQSSQESYTREWEDTEDLLGREGFQELFAHIRMIKRKNKLKETMLQEYQKYIVPSGTDAAKFIDDVVVPYADAYELIKTAGYQSSHGADAVNALLNWLNRIDNLDWVPPAIVYVAKQMHDAPTLAKFLTDLERLAAGQMILRKNINERINRYAEVLTAIEQGGNLYAADSPLQLTDAEKQDIVKILDGDLYLEAKTRLYVLLRLDSELSKGQASYNYPTITVEHVLPQNPSSSSVWMQWFPTEDSRNKYTHRVGNLLLLPRKKNSEAQNYDFDVKKQKYFTSAKGVSSFALTSQVLREKDWTAAVVEKRQQELIKAMKLIWKL
jgi:Protein of unknown function DUF262/Protein of unknown function (DUF1524)